MPKLKSNKAARKRFKVTGTGKVLAKKSGKRHGMSNKSGNAIRGKRRRSLVLGSNAKDIKSIISV